MDALLRFIGEAYPLCGLLVFVYLLSFAYLKGWEIEGVATHVAACAIMAVMWPLTIYEIAIRLKDHGRL